MDPNEAVQRPPMYEKYVKPTMEALHGKQSLSSWNDVDWNESGVPASFVMVLITEVGDKTFFLAMLLAMRHGKLAVFVGAMFALFFMTAGSAYAGYLVASSADLLAASEEIMDVCAMVLFGIFGTQLLSEAYRLHRQEANDSEMRQLLGSAEESTPTHGERQDAEETLREVDEKEGEVKSWWGAVWQTFTLMFVAEWGDRSMFATLALATQHNILGVIVGAMAAHMLANIMAVVGGEMLSNIISEKIMALTGGCVFILFALLSAYEAILK